MAWLASEFLSMVRRKASLADSANSPDGTTDADLLLIADQEIQTQLVPLLVSAREEFFVLKQSTAFTGTASRVRVPGRTIGGRVRDVRAVVGGIDNAMTRWQPTDKPWLQPTSAPGPLSGYYLEGEWIQLLPAPTQPGTLDVYYLGRPSRLTVTASDFRAITVTSSTTWTFATGATFGSTVDLVRGTSGLTALAQDLAGTGTTTTFVPTDTTITAMAVVGDYVCKPDVTPLIPMPVEFHGVLVSRVVAAVLRQLGKYGEASEEMKHADIVTERALELLTTRTESQTANVRGGIHFRGGGGYGRWGTLVR